jgi:hypothetical protein
MIASTQTEMRASVLLTLGMTESNLSLSELINLCFIKNNPAK